MRVLQIKKYLLPLFTVLLWLSAVSVANAASLSLTPGTGVYQANSTFSVNVVVNTEGQPINAAEGVLSFNPNELSVVAVNRGSSIFNLWVTEPSFSNSAGSITFSGGVPSGFSGARGTVMSITFRSKGAGSPRVSFTSGSVLANDGRGTNVLTNMNGGSYTIQAQSAAPEPEIIEYIATANTPAAPVIESDTHGDPTVWHNRNSAELSWSLPSGVTGVRTLLDGNPTAVPVRVYEDPIRSISLEDLPEGESYFHIQFRNAEGWGRVTNYRLAVDTESPSKISINLPEDADLTNPVQSLLVEAEDATSEVSRFSVKVDDNEPFEVELSGTSSIIELPALEPGYHSFIVEGFDQAGNGIIGSFSFTIEAFERPVLTEIPSEVNENVIPVMRGTTRPGAAVDVFFGKVGTEPQQYTVTADESGVFTFIPEGVLTSGVYEISARATDVYGAQSEMSATSRVAVQQPGYIQIGTMLVSVLSIIVPLAVLSAFLVIGFVYLIAYLRRFRRKVRVESTEALEILHREFSTLQSTLRAQESAMQKSRKTSKLTKAEAEMIEVLDLALQDSQRKVEKEIQDVTELTERNESES